MSTDGTDHAARFTVVIPTHDRAGAVASRVAELQAMEGAPEELVVVADGCTDDTVERITELAGVGRTALQVLSTDGLGPASARNHGAARATGTWLVFLDDDDLPGPTWMTAWRELAQRHPDARYLSTAYWHRTGDNQHVAQPRALGPAFSSVTASHMPGTYAVRRDAFEGTGGFTEGLRFLECTELALRLFADLASEPAALAVGTEPTIVRVHRPPAERHAVRPEIQVPSSRVALAAMRPRLRRDPALLANCLAALGVAELRLGDTAAGCRTLREAARTDPWPPKHLIRALVALVPPLRRRAWTRTAR